MSVRGYPDRALRLLLGFSPGSASDNLAQLIAPSLSLRLGQQVIVERHPGENGAIAAQLAARSAPDGYTLFMATFGTHAIAPCFRRDLPYHPLRDFAPVTLLARAPLVLADHPGLPATTVGKLIEIARTQDAALTFASSAHGGAPHLAGELFNLMAGVRMRHARYDDTRKLYADLVAGRVSVSFNNVMSMLPLLRDGKLRGLATTGRARLPVLPALPTLAEAGLAGYEVVNWLGIVAPAGTPREIIESLHAETSALLHAGEIHECLSSQGVEPAGKGPDAFALHIERELERWAPVIGRIAAACAVPQQLR